MVELGSVTVTEDEIVDFARAVGPAAVPRRSRGRQGVRLRRPDRERLAHRRDVDAALRRLAARRRRQHGLARDRGAALARAGAAGRHADRPADRARDDAVRAAPRPRHRPDPRRDGQPGRRHGDGDDLARPLRPAPCRDPRKLPAHERARPLSARDRAAPVRADPAAHLRGPLPGADRRVPRRGARVRARSTPTTTACARSGRSRR